jgi:hypothetical protein
MRAGVQTVSGRCFKLAFRDCRYATGEQRVELTRLFCGNVEVIGITVD